MMTTMMRDDDDPLHLFFFGRQRGRPRGGVWMRWFGRGRVTEAAAGGGSSLLFCMILFHFINAGGAAGQALSIQLRKCT